MSRPARRTCRLLRSASLAILFGVSSLPAFPVGVVGSRLVNPALTDGYAAISDNPAQLGQPGMSRASLRLGDLTVQGMTNGLELGDYGRYFMRPVMLSEADKNSLLGRLGTAPLRLALNSSLLVVAGNYRALAAGAYYRDLAVQAYPRDLFDIILNGNELNRRYDLSGWGADTLAYWRASVALGWPVRLPLARWLGADPTLSAGMTRDTDRSTTSAQRNASPDSDRDSASPGPAKRRATHKPSSARRPRSPRPEPVVPLLRAGLTLSWLHGTRYVRTTSSIGELLTTPYAITGSSQQTRQEAGGGNGLAITPGVSWQLNEHWQAALSAPDLLAGILWHRSPATRELLLVLDSLCADRYVLQPVLDSFIVRHDRQVPAGSFVTSLPGMLALGIAWNSRSLGPDSTPPVSGFRAGIALNVPLGSNSVTTPPPLAGVTLAWRPLFGFAVGLALGWHPAASWTADLGLAGVTASGFEFRLGGGLQGRSLSAARAAQLNLGFSYSFD